VEEEENVRQHACSGWNNNVSYLNILKVEENIKCCCKNRQHWRRTGVEGRCPVQSSLIELVDGIDADAQLLDAPPHHIAVAIASGFVKSVAE
jgi:hypothetical protein